MRILAILTTLFFHLTVHAEIQVRDDENTVITLNEPAKRIISLSPGNTELLFSAGGGEFVKGVVSFSDYPEAAKSIPQIGNFNSIDLERVLSLKPDLIVAWKSGNPPLQISKLKELGLTVFMSEPRSFSDIPETIIKFGKLMNTEKQAKKSVTKFNNRLNKIKSQYTGNFPKKRVFIQIWDSPIMSINGEHLISRIVERCNGVNIFSNHPTLTLTPGTETVLKENPDVIIVTRSEDLGNSWLDRWKQWPFISAVKNNQLFTAIPDHFVRHTDRIILGMEAVCKQLNK